MLENETKKEIITGIEMNGYEKYVKMLRDSWENQTELDIITFVYEMIIYSGKYNKMKTSERIFEMLKVGIDTQISYNIANKDFSYYKQEYKGEE